MGWGVNDYPGPPPEKYTTVCPVCGTENVDVFYEDMNGDIVGCDECITKLDAWDYVQEE